MDLAKLDVTGKAIADAIGRLHVEDKSLIAICDSRCLTYPLHWATTTTIACAECISRVISRVIAWSACQGECQDCLCAERLFRRPAPERSGT